LDVWNPLIELSEEIKKRFDKHLNKSRTEHFFNDWEDTFWESDIIRKCHLKTIDNRETQKTWLLHVNIFPNIQYDFPILGFDIVAGKNKITGSFFDYSPVNKNHEYMSFFNNTTKQLEWNKPRELPDWAKEIFSNNMIAVGNLKDEAEISQLCDVSSKLINYYLDNLEEYAILYDTETIKNIHNKYCVNQKKNPHLHRSILSMGISESEKDEYVSKHLFQEI
jgi:hypothetical protein